MYHTLDLSCLSLSFSSSDETAGLVHDLADLLSLRRTEIPGDVHAIVYSCSRPTEAVASIVREADQTGWRSYDVRGLLTVHERPDRGLFLCGVRDLPTAYGDPRMGWIVISVLVCSLLALLTDRVLLIHGALVTNGGTGYVLTGPSGVGKSTAASRVPSPWNAAADDLMAAVRTKEGYVLHPLPTWSQLTLDEEPYRPVEVTASFSVGGIYFLEQSATDDLEAVTPAAARERLLRTSYDVYHLWMLSFSEEARRRCKLGILRNAASITSQAPSFIMNISRDGRFWDLIRQE